MSTFKNGILAAALLLPCTAHADITIAQPVKNFNYDGAGDYFYITGVNGWGSPSCANATYVVIRPAVAGRKQIFAAVLAAQASGKSIRFQGSCDDANYFSATYIEVIG